MRRFRGRGPRGPQREAGVRSVLSLNSFSDFLLFLRQQVRNGASFPNGNRSLSRIVLPEATPQAGVVAFCPLPWWPGGLPFGDFVVLSTMTEGTEAALRQRGLLAGDGSPRRLPLRAGKDRQQAEGQETLPIVSGRHGRTRQPSEPWGGSRVVREGGQARPLTWEAKVTCGCLRERRSGLGEQHVQMS